MFAINDLSVRHARGQRGRLQGFDLRVGPGECAVVLGPAGAGKSAVCEAVMGLCAIDSGTIRVGRAAVDADAVERRRHITAIWGTGAVDDALTVRQNVQLALRLAGMIAPSVNVIDHALQVMEIPDRRITAEAGALTRIERFSTWLAIAVLRRTPILLLDDPAATWTPAEVRTVTPLLTEFKRTGVTVVMVTRDSDFARSMADRIVLLENGRKVAEGAPSVIFNTTESSRP